MAKFEFRIPEGHPPSEKILDVQLQHATKQMEMGLLGSLFGDKKPENVAGFAITLAFLGIMVAAFAPVATDFPRRELITGCIGIITGALGFVFGHSKGQSG